MKKSELRNLIREVLHEELLKEAPEPNKHIDEKGFLSSLNRSISDDLGGENFVDEAGNIVATVSKDLSAATGPSHENDGARRYLCTLADNLPADAKATSSLQQKISKLSAFWRKNLDSRTDCMGFVKCYYSKRGPKLKTAIFEVEIIPNFGYEIFTKEMHDYEFNRI